MQKHLELYATILRLVGQTKRMNDLRNTIVCARFTKRLGILFAGDRDSSAPIQWPAQIDTS